MGKVIAYTALIVVCLGLGALAGGLGVYFGVPHSLQHTVHRREAICIPVENKGAGSSSISGRIELSQASNMDLEITVKNITGLPDQRKFGFHIHSFGIIGEDCTSAGSHFNPRNMDHGGPNSTERHVGDLGNFDVQEYNYNGFFKRIDPLASLFGEDSILGRSIVIHAEEDDLQDVASAGARLACCTILRANTVASPKLPQTTA